MADSVESVLTRARELIADPARWQRSRWYASDAAGAACSPRDPRAARWDLLGALAHVIGAALDTPLGEQTMRAAELALRASAPVPPAEPPTGLLVTSSGASVPTWRTAAGGQSIAPPTRPDPLVTLNDAGRHGAVLAALDAAIVRARTAGRRR